jgi:predicted nucleic-acid-binding Zn-ribbon protein
MAMSLHIRDVDKAFGDEDVFEDDIDLSGKHVSRDFHLKNKKYKNVILQNCKFKELIFDNCEFESLVVGSCLFKFLKIDKCRFDRDIDILYCESEKDIIIKDSEAESNVDIGYTYGSIIVESTRSRYVAIYGENIDRKIKSLALRGDFGNSTIVRVGQDFSKKKEDLSVFETVIVSAQNIILRVMNVKSDVLYLWGSMSEKSDLIFDSVESKKLSISNLVATSSVVFRSVKIDADDSELKIKSSVLGGAKFVFCDFSRVHKFYLIDSFLDGIKSNGSKWPINVDPENPSKNVADTNYNYEAELDRARKRKASFSQMRNIMAISGEKYHESQYRYLELDEQVKENIGLPDKVSLWVSKISSNHGANWVWALVVLLCVNLFFNGFMCLAHGGIRAVHEYFLKNYFVILNPLYNSRDLFRGTAENEVVLSMLVFFSRVFTAYMYYQIVKSFRKYG